VPNTFREGFVKICGVTTVPDGVFAAHAGASALGLNLAEGSPRRVNLAVARDIVAATNDDVLVCAVFRGRSDEAILLDLEDLAVDAVQLHDAVSDSLLDALRAKSLIVIKALNIEGRDFEEFDDARVEAVLIDGPRPGSGIAHSWSRLRERSFNVPVIAAGGLTPDNVTSVIESTSVIGVDCASGVERSPGIKDDDAVSRFVTNARRAFAMKEVR
jgi:phosphoribosylanthranilate isomerase